MKCNECVIYKVEFQDEFMLWCGRAMSEVYFVFSYLWMSPFLCPIAVPVVSL